jgi:hypothetical protein
MDSMGDDWYAFFPKYKSFIGSAFYGREQHWYNIISVRHRNGESDGIHYGMYIAAGLNFNGNLFWNKQTGQGVWQGERQILDSVNYSSYALPLAGGTVTGQLLVKGGTDNYGILIGAGSNTIDSWKADGNNAGLYLNWQSAGSIIMGMGGGNVLIGTTTDWGSRLTVNGDLRVLGAIRFKEYTYNTLINFGWTADDGDFVDFYNVGNTASNANLKMRIGVWGITITQQLWVGSNITASGSITHGSDIRYKAIDSYADIDIETIANAPIINFRWTDREDDRLYLGSSAQYWYNTSLCNGVIPTDNEKLWTMGYGEIALAGLVSVAKKVVNHEERLQIVEKELAEYKEENKQLKQQLNEYRRLS